MTLSVQQLDTARQAWLRGLREAHAHAPTATTALELARALWLMGNYDEALPRFVESRDRAPEDPQASVALLRAASALGHDALERTALDAALARHPRVPELLLHGALRRIPGDLPGACAMLSGAASHPLCALYAAALTLLIEGRSAGAPSLANRDGVARWEGFTWLLARTPPLSAWCGLPIAVLRKALAAAPGSGLTLECGVYFGRSLGLIAAASPGEVHGFDSFQGLPEAWKANEPAGAYSTAGRLPAVPGNVRLHAGWFEDTLPPFFRDHPGPIRLLHIDCDLYSSTRSVLGAAAERLVPGSILLFDDLLGYPGYERHEFLAFREFAAHHRLGWEVVAACLLGREVAIRITSR